MRSRIAVLACLIATAASLATSPARAAGWPTMTSLRFGLCAAIIAESWVKETDEGNFTLAFRLDETGLKQLQEQWEQHPYAFFYVVFDGAVLEEHQFRDDIPNGYIETGRWSSRDAAAAMLRLIGDRPPNVPCGPIPPAISPLTKD